MEKKILPYLVVISALSVSLSAAFYSVTGIGKMCKCDDNDVIIRNSQAYFGFFTLSILG